MIPEDLGMIREIGRAGLHNRYPNDFEYYITILELANSEGKTVDYLSFPVNPDSISYDDELLTNIKKTLGGIVATDSGSNRPKKISMSGTFGRKFRLLMDINNNPEEEGLSSGISVSQDKGFEIKSNVFNARLKTGYGTTKLLKGIVEKSVQLDKQNNPYKVYLYLPSLGESYLVKFNSLRLNQDYSTSNMLWKYSITMTVIGDLSDMTDEKSRPAEKLKLALIQKGVNTVLNQVKKMI